MIVPHDSPRQGIWYTTHRTELKPHVQIRSYQLMQYKIITEMNTDIKAGIGIILPQSK